MAYRSPEPLDKHHQLDHFDCGKASLNEWLTKHARTAAASDSAKVFVSTLDDEETVVGYYALAAAQVEPEDAVARALKGQPGSRPVPAILLARLAVDQNHQGEGLGTSLLQDILLRVVGAADEIGARILLIHAMDEEAKSWYLQYGFEESPTDPLHLQMLMKDVRASVARASER